jgi:hypothetical protein
MRVVLHRVSMRVGLFCWPGGDTFTGIKTFGSLFGAEGLSRMYPQQQNRGDTKKAITSQQSELTGC